MLPVVFGAVLPLMPASELEVEEVPLLLAELEEGLVALLLLDDVELSTVSLSFTFFTPGTDSTICLACLRSCFDDTLPSSVATPLFTVTFTFERAGLVVSCC